MYEETKSAIKKAFEIGRALFFMGPKRYSELLSATSKVKPPTIQELNTYVEDGWVMEDAVIEILRERYKQIAIESGFTEKQGLAMLEYAAMLEELNYE
ncbi:MAG: hypothetical protein WC516_04985 [Patescibacteria group bacterium]|jgi:hypothetical protein